MTIAGLSLEWIEERARERDARRNCVQTVDDVCLVHALADTVPALAARVRELEAVLRSAQETLRPIAGNGRKYGPIYSHAMQTLHQIAAALSPPPKGNADG